MLTKLWNWLLGLPKSLTESIPEITIQVIEPDDLLTELKKAWEQYFQALENLNNADPEFVDVAIVELEAAERRHTALMRLTSEVGR